MRKLKILVPLLLVVAVVLPGTVAQAQTAPPGTPVVVYPPHQASGTPPATTQSGPQMTTQSSSASCANTIPQNATDTRQLTQFSVNTGVLGPNVYIWEGAEIVITNPNLYGYVVGYVNTNGSVASGPFVAGGNYYVSLALYQPNILVMIPLYETFQYHGCSVPPSPVPVWH